MEDRFYFFSKVSDIYSFYYQFCEFKVYQGVFVIFFEFVGVWKLC